MRFATFLAFGLILFAQSALCAPSAADLEEIQAQLEEERKAQTHMHEKAQNVAAEVSSVRKQMVKAANLVQNNEETLTALEKNLKELEEKKV